MTLLWLTSLALTLATVLAIAIPVWQRSKHDQALVGEYEHDAAVYRHQLQELEAETKRGIISESDSAQARTEIARRLLAAEDKAATERTARDGRERRFANVFLIATLAFFVPGLTYIVYTGVGSPQLPAQPLEARIEMMREQERAAAEDQIQMAQLVERAETHLAGNPDDGEGWSVLAPVYFRMGQPDKAETAYRNAIRILGPDPARLSGLGEALFAQSGGVVTAEAMESFQNALELDDSDSRARFYLGLAMLQGGDMDAGREAWASLAADTSADPDWIGAAQEGIRRIAAGDMSQIPGMVQAEAPPPAAPGMPQLDRDTIESATQMDADAQAEMIAGMVATLDARLRESPDDVDGWKRLIRAHVVMNNNDAALDALNRALDAGSENADVVADLRNFAAQLGLQSPGG